LRRDFPFIVGIVWIVELHCVILIALPFLALYIAVSPRESLAKAYTATSQLQSAKVASLMSWGDFKQTSLLSTVHILQSVDFDMSFGFGVGDFLMVGTLTLQLWRSFKNAPGEFSQSAAS
jgi:hypothetical protein